MLNIRTIRKSRGLTQTQLAKCVGVRGSTVSNWELGIRQPSICMVQNVANVLHCTVDDLLREDYNISTVPKNGLLVKS